MVFYLSLIYIVFWQQARLHNSAASYQIGIGGENSPFKFRDLDCLVGKELSPSLVFFFFFASFTETRVPSLSHCCSHQACWKKSALRMTWPVRYYLPCLSQLAPAFIKCRLYAVHCAKHEHVSAGLESPGYKPGSYAVSHMPTS